MKKEKIQPFQNVRPVSLRLPREIVEKLKELAHQNRRSLNGQVEIILREYFGS